MSATTPWPRAWTASWCRCAASWPAASAWRSSPPSPSSPKPQWLEFVVSGKARTSIRQQLKQLEHEDAVQLGHRMLDRALEAQATSLERVPAQRMDAFLAEHRYPRLEALLADIALGNRMPQQVAQALAREASAKTQRACRTAAAAQRGQDPDHRCRARRDQLRPVLPADSRRRDHGLPHRRQGHRGAPAGLPQCRRVPQVARPLGADRLGSRGQRRFPDRDAHRARQPVRVRWPRWPPRSPRPNRTSTGSNTSNATPTSPRSASRSKCATASTWPK